MSEWWQTVLAIAWKDWRLERRMGQAIGSMVVFAIAAVVSFNFALDANLGAARNVATGLLWTVIWLAGTLGINRSFSAETETNALDALRIAPISSSAIFFGKWLSLCLYLFLAELLIVPMFIIFFNRPFYNPLFLLYLILGTFGYVGMGVFVGGMAAQTRANYLLVPVLILPLTLPLVLSAATGSAESLLPSADGVELRITLLLTITYDLLILIAGAFLYHYVLEE